MTELHAKPVIDGKFWIVEDQGNKVGILKVTEQKKYVFSSKDKVATFDNKKKLFETFGKDFFISRSFLSEKEVDTEVHGYSTSSTPHNPMFDVRKIYLCLLRVKKVKAYIVLATTLLNLKKDGLRVFVLN